MRNLSCTFTIDGCTKKVVLRKIAQERRFQAVIDGEKSEFILCDNNEVKHFSGPELELQLHGRIQWMITHYFSNAKAIKKTELAG